MYKLLINKPAALAASMLFLNHSAQAALVDIGSGLIYDSTNNVTWVSDGLTFTKDIVANGTGALVGTVVHPQIGADYTVTAEDFLYTAALTRETATFYGATAWVNKLMYSYGSNSITGWRLPTVAELNQLWAQVGSYCGATGCVNGPVAPFTWIPPKIFTSTEIDATNVYYVDYALSKPGSNVVSTSVPKTNSSNVWAVVPGNVANMIPAGVAHYNVSITFLDDTTFTGSFSYNSSTQQISNLQGVLNDVLMGNIETLNYQLQLGPVSDKKGGIIATVFELNTTAIGTNPPINNNVGVAIDFNAIDPTLGATDPTQLAYMDCSAGGLMGLTCMYDLSWHNPVFPMSGGHGVLSQKITASGQVSRSDCLFNWAETNYPQLFSPAGATSQTLSPYYYRFYQNTHAYLGVSSANSHVYYLDPNGKMQDVGQLSTWLTAAGC